MLHYPENCTCLSIKDLSWMPSTSDLGSNIAPVRFVITSNDVDAAYEGNNGLVYVSPSETTSYDASGHIDKYTDFLNGNYMGK